MIWGAPVGEECHLVMFRWSNVSHSQNMIQTELVLKYNCVVSDVVRAHFLWANRVTLRPLLQHISPNSVLCFHFHSRFIEVWPIIQRELGARICESSTNTAGWALCRGGGTRARVIQSRLRTRIHPGPGCSEDWGSQRSVSSSDPGLWRCAALKGSEGFHTWTDKE